MKVSLTLLSLALAGAVFAAMPAGANQAAAEKKEAPAAKKETKWQGHVVRIYKDLSQMDISGGPAPSKAVRKVAYDTLSKRDRKARHLAAAAFLQETGEEKFVEAIGQRRGGREGEHRIAAKENDNRHARGGFVIAPAVSGADFLELPVHAGGALVVDLDAIHADIAFASVWIFGDDAGERDETSAVQGPAFLDREIEQSGKLRIEN